MDFGSIIGYFFPVVPRNNLQFSYFYWKYSTGLHLASITVAANHYSLQHVLTIMIFFCYIYLLNCLLQ